MLLLLTNKQSERDTLRGYELFFNNLYTSPLLLKDLLEYEILSTGTLNVTWKDVLPEIANTKFAIEKQDRFTGYYFCSTDSHITFTHDTKTVVIASIVVKQISETIVSFYLRV